MTHASGTSRVLMVASLQRLKMEDLIPAPADCEVKSVIKFWMHRAYQLTPEHKAHCMESTLIFLQRYHDDGNELLDRIITGDKTCAAHITPETKQKSLHWRHSGSPCKTKFKQITSACEVMCTVFWGRVVPIPGGRLLRHRITKVSPTVWQISQFRRWICWKIAQHLLYLFQ